MDKGILFHMSAALALLRVVSHRGSFPFLCSGPCLVCDFFLIFFLNASPRPPIRVDKNHLFLPSD